MGRFTKVEGELEVGDDRSISGSGRAEISSIKTGLGLRDRHLRSGHFFDVNRHPYATFNVSARDVDARDLQLEVVLTIKGVSRKIQLSAAVEPAEGRSDALRLKARGSIRRRDFGVVWIAPDALMIGNKVRLSVDAILER